MECKQMSDHSSQTYERLNENPEMKSLELQLQEVKQQAVIVQVELNPLSTIERMK
jgi:hypothetical protein